MRIDGVPVSMRPGDRKSCAHVCASEDVWIEPGEESIVWAYTRVGSFFRGAVYSRFLSWFLPSGRNYFFQFLPEESGRNQHFFRNSILFY